MPLKRCRRIGAIDTTFKMPGMSEEQLVLQLPSNAGYEMRLYTDQALFIERPANCVKFTGIVNT